MKKLVSLMALAIHAGNAGASLQLDDPAFQSTWTHLSERIPQGAGMPDEMVSAEVFRIYPGGSFSMFLGGLLINFKTGASSISEGTPIQGYVGRWIQTDNGLLVAYIKVYEWPQGLSEHSGEKPLDQIHVEEITRRGKALEMNGRTFGSAAGPSLEKYQAAMGMGENLWKSRKELQVSLDSALMRRAAEKPE